MLSNVMSSAPHRIEVATLESYIFEKLYEFANARARHMSMSALLDNDVFDEECSIGRAIRLVRQAREYNNMWITRQQFNEATEP